LSEPPRQCLGLIAASEESESAGIFLADLGKPLRGQLHRLIPADLLELAGAARTHTFQGRPQACRRVMLHDAGRALAAQHALVHGMIAVTLDVANLAVL